MRAAYIWGLVLGAVLLAGCFASQAGQLAEDPDAPWIPGLPIANSFAGIVDLDSDPSGTEVTTSLGGECRTPCSLEVSAEGPFTVTFTHEGYAPTTVQVKIQHARMGVSERKFAPNPVFAQLAPVAKPLPVQAAHGKPVPAAQPAQAAPRKPVAAVQSAARPGPAQPAWPAEPKPKAGNNSSPIVPAARPAPAQPAWPEPVAAAGFVVKGHTTAPAVAGKRWLENFDKPASDQDPDKKKQ